MIEDESSERFVVFVVHLSVSTWMLELVWWCEPNSTTNGSCAWRSWTLATMKQTFWRRDKLSLNGDELSTPWQLAQAWRHQKQLRHEDLVFLYFASCGECRLVVVFRVDVGYIQMTFRGRMNLPRQFRLKSLATCTSVTSQFDAKTWLDDPKTCDWTSHDELRSLVCDVRNSHGEAH